MNQTELFQRWVRILQTFMSPVATLESISRDGRVTMLGYAGLTIQLSSADTLYAITDALFILLPNSGLANARTPRDRLLEVVSAAHNGKTVKVLSDSCIEVDPKIFEPSRFYNGECLHECALHAFEASPLWALH